MMELESKVLIHYQPFSKRAYVFHDFPIWKVSEAECSCQPMLKKGAVSCPSVAQ